ncbi:hypothetical protein [Rhizomonospora bruguierae]|uniref:hypothetical protein n=1 Tax=Rhizomonospora bruguierae TaxID=1581705 RepID=UPI001BD03AEB|nr:hypothetical protein [Micromonospora sp. NBRC 107566]
MPRRRRVWVWTGRSVATLCVAGLGGYLYLVGLDKADKVASAIASLIAVAALVAPYLLPARGQPSDPRPRPGGPEGATAIQVTGDVRVLAKGTSAAAVSMRDVTVGAVPVDPPPPGRSRD